MAGSWDSLANQISLCNGARAILVTRCATLACAFELLVGLFDVELLFVASTSIPFRAQKFSSAQDGKATHYDVLGCIQFDLVLWMEHGIDDVVAAFSRRARFTSKFASGIR